MTCIRETAKWHLGRRGELLVTAVFARFGFILLDASATANNRAPLLHKMAADIVSPDHLVMRKATFFMDTKTKQYAPIWQGGGLGRDSPLSLGPVHGIEQRSLHEYRDVERHTHKPVVIAVVCIDDGELLANTLGGLGEPFASINPAALDVVSWSASRFRRVCRFDRRRLREYFSRPDGSQRLAPDAMPSAIALQKLVDWLRPEQAEFEWLVDDLINRLEDEWGATP